MREAVSMHPALDTFDYRAVYIKPRLTQRRDGLNLGSRRILLEEPHGGFDWYL
jgi:hypothetical protein